MLNVHLWWFRYRRICIRIALLGNQSRKATYRLVRFSNWSMCRIKSQINNRNLVLLVCLGLSNHLRKESIRWKNLRNKYLLIRSWVLRLCYTSEWYNWSATSIQRQKGFTHFLQKFYFLWISLFNWFAKFKRSYSVSAICECWRRVPN